MTVSARPCSPPPAVGASAPRLLTAFRLMLYGGLAIAAVWGGPVLRVAAVCAIALALLIDWKGGVRHLLRMTGLALAIWLAPQYGGWLGNLASTHWGVSPAISNVAGIGLLGVLIVAAGALLARLASRQVRRHRLSEALDHMFGGLLGAAEAGLAVACACWILAALAGPLASVQARASRNGDDAGAATAAGAAQRHAVGSQQQPVSTQPQTFDIRQIQQHVLNTLAEINATVRDDPAGQWLTRANPLEQLSSVKTAGLMLEVASDPAVLLSALDKGRLQALTALPELRKYAEAIEHDPELRAALERQDFAAVLSHPQVKAMLTDPDLRRTLFAHLDELRTALEAADQAAVTGTQP